MPQSIMNLLSVFYKVYEHLLWRQVQGGSKPNHIGLIVDGNRRFAKLKGFPDAYNGHAVGSDNLEKFLRWCRKLNIRIVTLYAFSMENNRRSPDEVDYLMNLILKKLKAYQIDPVIKAEHVKIKVIGRLKALSTEMQEEIINIESMTECYDRFQINIALNYSGRAEIVDAAKKLALEVKNGRLDVDDIDEETFSQYLYTQGTPDPDFIIRTSGEERLSGFLPWQSAYSELYFTEVFWPAFRMIDFWRAIRVYQQRERRYGR